MENTQEKDNQRIEEITLKEIILKVQEYIRYFWSKKLFFIIPFILFVGFFIYKAKTAPFIFTAETKFFLEGNKSSNMGGLGGLLGQIGGKKTNPYQIIEVAESKLLLTDVLFEKIGPDSIFIANKILDVYDLPETWGENSPEFLNFKFSHKDAEKFTRLENSALLRLIRRVLDNSKGEALITTKFHDDKGYYHINASSLDHDLALFLSEKSYKKLKEYFEDKTREKLRATRDILKVKSDSIKFILESRISQLAKFKDKNKSLVYNIDQVQEIVLENEILGLNSAYMEVLKSFEMADYNYSEQKNHFMLIDKPIAPLGIIFPNWQVEAIKGGVLSLFLSFGLLFFYKLYKDIMEP